MEQKQRVQKWIERKSRRDVDLSAIAHRSGGSEVAVRVSNISYEGCQLELTTAGLTVSETLALNFRDLGEIEAQVQWTTLDGKAGVRFLLEKPILRHRRTRVTD